MQRSDLANRSLANAFAIVAGVLVPGIAGSIATTLIAGTAEGGVLVAPTRLVFEARDRVGTFTLINPGTTTERYRISLVQRRMTPEGKLVAVEPAELRDEDASAEALLRFSPRQVVLRPNEPQTVRIMARKPADLATGEYRSHLLLQQVPAAPPAAPGDTGSDLSVKLTPIYGVSLPLIVRHGQLDAKARISEARLETGADGRPELRFRLERAGTRSLHGDVRAYQHRAGEPPRRVGLAKGISLYVPNRAREVRLPLDLSDPASARTGLLRFEFRETDARTNGASAEGSLSLSEAN